MEECLRDWRNWEFFKRSEKFQHQVEQDLGERQYLKFMAENFS